MPIMTTVADIAATRYTTKAFDPSRRIPDETVAQLLSVLHKAPSSINSQPWHFILAATPEAREKITAGTPEAYSYNAAKIRNASHVIVFCAHNALEDAHLADILAHETAAGRFPNDDAKAAQMKSRSYYANLHRVDKQDAVPWMEKQVYLALGALLFAAGAAGVDACPIEGFDAAALDQSLNLEAQGLSSQVLVALGRKSDKDFNAGLPKSRLDESVVITEL